MSNLILAFLFKAKIRLNSYKAEVNSLSGLLINTYKDYLGVELEQDASGRMGLTCNRFRHDIIRPYILWMK